MKSKSKGQLADRDMEAEKSRGRIRGLLEEVHLCVWGADGTPGGFLAPAPWV